MCSLIDYVLDTVLDMFSSRNRITFIKRLFLKRLNNRSKLNIDSNLIIVLKL